METFPLVEFWESHLQGVPILVGGILLLTVPIVLLSIPWSARTPEQRRSRTKFLFLLGILVGGLPTALFVVEGVAHGPSFMALRVGESEFELSYFPWPFFRRLPISDVSAVMVVRNVYDGAGQGTWSLWVAGPEGRWRHSAKGGRRLPVLTAARRLAGRRGVELRWAVQDGFEVPRDSTQADVVGEPETAVEAP